MRGDVTMATILGLIFFAPFVIFAYRCNTYFLNNIPLTGGRLFWRQIGWSILTAIPFVGLIYGLINLSNIYKAREEIRNLNYRLVKEEQ